jgi:hypothetical protein
MTSACSRIEATIIMLLCRPRLFLAVHKPQWRHWCGATTDCFPAVLTHTHTHSLSLSLSLTLSLSLSLCHRIIKSAIIIVINHPNSNQYSSLSLLPSHTNIAPWPLASSIHHGTPIRRCHLQRLQQWQLQTSSRVDELCSLQDQKQQPTGASRQRALTGTYPMIQHPRSAVLTLGVCTILSAEMQNKDRRCRDHRSVGRQER